MLFDWLKTTAIKTKVTSVSDVTPHMRRVTLYSERLRDVQHTQPGQFLGVTFPSELGGHVRKPKRFTIRDFDGEAGTLALEFALHGEAGIASSWALKAQVGDELILSRPGRGYSVDKRTRNHVLVGDPTFIPAVLEILHFLDESAEAFVFLEVQGRLDEQRLPSRARVHVTWVHSDEATPGTTGRVEEVLKGAALPERDCRAWVGGESRLARNVERHLSSERHFGRGTIEAHGYWRLA